MFFISQRACTRLKALDIDAVSLVQSPGTGNSTGLVLILHQKNLLCRIKLTWLLYLASPVSIPNFKDRTKP